MLLYADYVESKEADERFLFAGPGPDNRVRDFDDAIQSRITLAVRTSPLSRDTRKQIWASFLKKALTANGAAKYNPKDLNELAKKDFNGRQVRAP